MHRRQSVSALQFLFYFYFFSFILIVALNRSSFFIALLVSCFGVIQSTSNSIKLKKIIWINFTMKTNRKNGYDQFKIDTNWKVLFFFFLVLHDFHFELANRNFVVRFWIEWQMIESNFKWIFHLIEQKQQNLPWNGISKVDAIIEDILYFRDKTKNNNIETVYKTLSA